MPNHRNSEKNVIARLAATYPELAGMAFGFVAASSIWLVVGMVVFSFMPSCPTP